MKNNKIINRTLVGILIPSILLPSCTGPYFWGDGEIIEINQKGIEKNFTDDYTTTVLITFNSEDAKLLNFIIELTRDIVDDPSIARQFANNELSIAETYGVEDLEINMDDGLWKLIIALGDESIHNATIANDINLFFSLCEERGLLSELNESDVVKYISGDVTRDELGFVGAAAVLLLVVAGCAAAAAAAVWIRETYWNSKEGIVNPIVREGDTQAYQIWILKAGHENTYIMLDEYQEKIVNDCMDVLNNHYPEKMEEKNIDIEALRQLIRLNVSKLQ
jgi:hypothetical protein